MDYPWYELLEENDNTIQQGDLLKDCPILIPPEKIEEQKNKEIEVDVQLYNVVVMSQSCDLVQKKVEIVSVCPYITWKAYLEQQDASMRVKKGPAALYEKLKQGVLPNHHLLYKDEEIGLKNSLVVDFRYVYGIHFKYLDKYIKNQKTRIRLLPPYREHLSQAFARFFMRVGLPTDIPSLV